MAKHSILFWLRQPFRKYLKVLLLLGVVLLFFITPLRNLLNRELLSVFLQSLGVWAVPLFIATYVLVTVVGLPITIHTLTGGAIFGLVWGTVWSTIAATLGAIAAFWLSRSLFQSWALKTLGQHRLLKQFNQAVNDNPFNLVLMLRFAPIAPFNLINFLLALTSINLKVYSLATFIGVIPGTIAYTWIGVSGKTTLEQGDRLPLLLASSFLVFLSVLPLCLKRRR